MVSNVESSKSGTRSKRKTSMKFMKVKKKYIIACPLIDQCPKKPH